MILQDVFMHARIRADIELSYPKQSGKKQQQGWDEQITQWGMQSIRVNKGIVNLTVESCHRIQQRNPQANGCDEHAYVHLDNSIKDGDIEDMLYVMFILTIICQVLRTQRVSEPKNQMCCNSK